MSANMAWRFDAAVTWAWTKANEYLSRAGLRCAKFTYLDDFRCWPCAFIPSCEHVSSFLHHLSASSKMFDTALAPNQDDALIHDLRRQVRGDALRVMRGADRIDVKGDKIETRQSL